MGLMFGTRDHLDCLQDVPLKGADGEALCLAHKYSQVFFIAGVYVRDGGYVLRVRGRDAFYPMPTGEELASLQREGLLPATLPPHSIPTIELLFGYSLWLVLAATAVLAWWSGRRKRQRMARDEATPISTAPPTLATATDRWLADEVARVLEPGERVTHQAYVLDRLATSAIGAAQTKASYVALTDRRLVIVKARVGAFGPLRENKGVESRARAEVVAARRDGRVIALALADGHELPMYVPRTGKLSNQDVFLRDLPRLVGGTPALASARAVAVID